MIYVNPVIELKDRYTIYIIRLVLVQQVAYQGF